MGFRDRNDSSAPNGPPREEPLEIPGRRDPSQPDPKPLDDPSVLPDPRPFDNPRPSKPRKTTMSPIDIEIARLLSMT